MNNWIKLSVAAIAATAFSLSAHAVTVPLTGTDSSGNTVNSGWVAVYSDAYAAAGWNVNLTFTGLSSDGSQFDFAKSATFKSPAGNGIDGLEIDFQKVDPNAKELVISDEVLQNQTGSDWSAFQWKLASGGTAAFTFAATGPTSGFAISPYTNLSFADSNSTINFSGGSVAQGATWSPGANSSTGIAIVSGSESSFALKEIPVGTIAIPLPAAAYTGLSTLLGLALLAAAKSTKKLLA